MIRVERAQRLDGVPEQLDAHRLVELRRVDVDDPAAPGNLSGGTDDVHSPVAQRQRLQYETLRGQ